MPFLALEQPFELIKAFSYNSFLLYGVHDGNDDVLVRARNITNPGMRELAHDEFEIARRSYIGGKFFTLALLTGRNAEDVRHYHARHPSTEWFATRPAGEILHDVQQYEWMMYHFKGQSFPEPFPAVIARCAEREGVYSQVEELVKKAYASPIFLSKRR